MDTTSFSRPPGFSDYFGETVRLHRWIESTLLDVLDRAGFEEIRLPSLEYVELYHPDRLGTLFHDLVAARITEPAIFPAVADGGADDQRGSMQFWSTNDVILRPEFTAPIACHITGQVLERGRPRYLPIRYAYAGQVFRNVKPGPLRFREFRQVGAELVGCSAPLADLEMLHLACDAAEALGLPDWSLHLGHTGVFRGLLEDLGLSGAVLDAVVRELELHDRLRSRLQAGDDAVVAYAMGFVPQLADSLAEARSYAGGREEIPAELRRPDGVPASYWREVLPGLHTEKARLVWRQHFHLDDNLINAALGVSELAGDAEDFFSRVEEQRPSPRVRAMISHLEWLSEELPRRIIITPAASRGIGYYTGETFEIHIPATTASYTDVCGGGRYDELYKWIYDRSRATQAARGARPSPAASVDRLTAVGFAFGVERVAAALSGWTRQRPRIFVAVQHSDLVRQAYDLSRELRSNGLPCECHIGDQTNEYALREQLGHAERVGAVYVVIFGESEWRNGTVILRDMNGASQQALSLAEVRQKLVEWWQSRVLEG